MRIQCGLLLVAVLVSASFAGTPLARQATPDIKLTRDIKVISSAGARALADACTAWAEKNKLIVAMAILDWGGNVIESHAMEGAAPNAIDTALLKAKSSLRWRRATSETHKMVRSGENLAPTFMNDFRSRARCRSCSTVRSSARWASRAAMASAARRQPSMPFSKVRQSRPLSKRRS